MDEPDESPPAVLPGRGPHRARPDRGALLPQHGPPHGARLRPQGGQRGGDDPVSRGAAAVLAAATLAAPPGAARGRLPALRRVHDVRDRLSGPLHLHRGRRAPEPRDREDAPALRHRSRQVRVLRLLRRSVPRGRDPHGYRYSRVLVLQSRWDDLYEGDVAIARGRRPFGTPALAGPAPRRPESVNGARGVLRDRGDRGRLGARAHPEAERNSWRAVPGRQP